MTSHRPFKDKLFSEIARLGGALSNAHRLELVDVLAQSERTVESLAEQTAMTVANTSRHLQLLLEARLVSVRAEGPYRYYRLSGPGVYHVWRTVRDQAATQFAEVDRLVRTYMDDPKELAPVRLDELRQGLERGEMFLVDVRPKEEFEAGHLAGAHSIPIDELASKLDELQQMKEVVAYCRGPFCLFSGEAVRMLNLHGIAARRLELGFPDLAAEGIPVATNSDQAWS